MTSIHMLTEIQSIKLTPKHRCPCPQDVPFYSGCATWHVESQVPDQGWNPGPLQQKHDVFLTSGLSGKSQGHSLFYTMEQFSFIPVSFHCCKHHKKLLTIVQSISNFLHFKYSYSISHYTGNMNDVEEIFISKERRGGRKEEKQNIGEYCNNA